MSKRLILGAILALALANPALSDEVTDRIDEARRSYEAGDLAAAEKALDSAGQLIRRKNGSRLTRFLPEPLSGWQAEDPQIETGPVLGGGTLATRLYSREDRAIEISIMVNSPMVQALTVVIDNPMMVGASGKLLIVEGRKVLYMSDDGSMQAVLRKGSGSALVQVLGGGDTPEDLLRDWFTAIDLDEIEASL